MRRRAHRRPGGCLQRQRNIWNRSTQNTLFDLRAAQIGLQGPGQPRPGLERRRSRTGRGRLREQFRGRVFWSSRPGPSFTLLDGNATPGGALYVTQLRLDGGLSQIASLHGNGLNIYYDVTDPSNAYLGGATYALAEGGFLMAAVPEPPVNALLLVAAAVGLGLLRQRNRRAW